MDKCKIVSLFDGASGGQHALTRPYYKTGIQMVQAGGYEYRASEIDKTAISLCMKAFPDTIQLGDVQKVSGADLGETFLLMGGSPCQGFSFAGKKLNFADPRSRLFFEFARILNETRPKYFLLENVYMEPAFQDVISKCLGVAPKRINSRLVSAQCRDRLYWTNIPNVRQPKDEGIFLKDIINGGAGGNAAAIRGRYLKKACILGRRINGAGVRDDADKTLKATQCIEVRRENAGKSNCLTTVAKDNVLTSLPYGRHVGAYAEHRGKWRYYTIEEMCALQNLPFEIFEGLAHGAATKVLGNGWNINTIQHILSHIPEFSHIFNTAKL